MQAVRIAALVHDLGHPPFSHVTEFALKDVSQELHKIPEDERNPAQNEFILSVGDYKTLLLGKEPHELLTLKLFEFLKKTILEEIDNQDQDADFLESAWFSLQLAYLILSEGDNTSSEIEKNLYKCLHKLIASDLDADRLDYVQRDSLLAGIRNDDLGLQRLIYLYQLKYVEEKHAQGKMSTTNVPLFLPNIRALRNLEEFFLARYSLYRNVIYHHHVVKTDAFLQNAVKELIIEYLSSHNNESHDTQEEGANLEIFWLWKIYLPQEPIGKDFLNEVYLRWDDHWLISLLRRRYIDLSRDDVHNKSSLDLKKLEELIASKRNYLSLVKRVEDFSEIDRSIVEFIRQKPNSIKKLSAHMRKLSKSNGSSKVPENISSAIESLQNISKLDESKGIISVTRSISFLLVYLNESYADFLEEFREEFLNTNKQLSDCVLVQKPMKPGVTLDFLVVSGQEALPFGSVSHLPLELKRRSENWPAFFCFILPNEKNIDRKNLRKSFGHIFAKQFLDNIPKLISNLTKNLTQPNFTHEVIDESKS